MSSKLNDSQAMGLIELLQLVMTHPQRLDYMDEDLKAALDWINQQLIERRI